MLDRWKKRYWHGPSRTRKTVTVVAAVLVGLTVLVKLTEEPPNSWVASAQDQCLYHANLESRFGMPRWPSPMFAHRAYDADDAKLGIATLVDPDVQFPNGSGGWERVTVTCTYTPVTPQAPHLSAP